MTFQLKKINAWKVFKTYLRPGVHAWRQTLWLMSGLCIGKRKYSASILSSSQEGSSQSSGNRTFSSSSIKSVNTSGTTGSISTRMANVEINGPKTRSNTRATGQETFTGGVENLDIHDEPREEFVDDSLEHAEPHENCIRMVGIILTDLEGNRFIPQSCMFASNPKDVLHTASIKKKIDELKKQAKIRHLNPEVVTVTGKMSYEPLDHVGGCSNGFQSRKFPPDKQNDWTLTKEQRSAEKARKAAEKEQKEAKKQKKTEAKYKIKQVINLGDDNEGVGND